MKPDSRLTFALHGTSRGFGYVVFEGPFTVHDWGTVAARGDKNAICLRRLDALLDRYLPATLLLEAWGNGSSLRSERIARLYQSAVSLAESKGIDVQVHRFKDVQTCFASAGAQTRQEIAEAVALNVDALRHRVPKARRAWDSEHRRMAVFCAAALVQTHFQFN